MNLAKQANPLFRLKLSIAAASLVLGGSLAALVQSPIADAHAASESVLVSISLSESIDLTPLAPSINVSPESSFQTGGFSTTSEIHDPFDRDLSRHFGDQSHSGHVDTTHVEHHIGLTNNAGRLSAHSHQSGERTRETHETVARPHDEQLSGSHSEQLSQHHGSQLFGLPETIEMVFSPLSGSHGEQHVSQHHGSRQFSSHDPHQMDETSFGPLGASHGEQHVSQHHGSRQFSSHDPHQADSPSSGSHNHHSVDHTTTPWSKYQHQGDASHGQNSTPWSKYQHPGNASTPASDGTGNTSSPWSKYQHPGNTNTPASNNTN